MRWLIPTAVAGLLFAGIAGASDDHHGTCEIEDWRWYGELDILSIEGVTTCNAGHIRIRVYDNKRKFPGIMHGYIQGHSFVAMGLNIQPSESLSIKYSIEPR